jgi:hypothetical protein
MRYLERVTLLIVEPDEPIISPELLIDAESPCCEYKVIARR